MRSDQFNANASPKRRSLRRFLQFRLRTLLLLTLAVAIGMFFYTRPEVIDEHPFPGYRVERQVYRDADGKPTNHGWWKLFDAHDRLICQGKYRSDKPSGRWTYWYANGRPRQRGEFKDGERNGLWKTWNEHGQPQLEVTYADGVLHGPTRAWHANGELAYEGGYDSGRRAGQWTLYNEQGKQMAAGRYENDLQEGEWLAWSDDDQPLPRREYVAGRLVQHDEKLLAALRQRLHSASFGQRSQAAWALNRRGQLGLAILDDACRSSDANVRCLALLELAKHSYWAETHVPRLVAALDEKPRKVHEAAMLALSHLGPAAKDGVPKLERWLDDADGVFRTSVLATLASIAPEREEIVERLALTILELRDEGSDAASDYLTGFAWPGIARAARSQRAEVRAAAASLVGVLAVYERVGPEPALEVLAAALSDSNPLVRKEACHATGCVRSATAAAEKHLQKATKDPDSEVAEAARAALMSLHRGGQGSGSGFF